MSRFPAPRLPHRALCYALCSGRTRPFSGATALSRTQRPSFSSSLTRHLDEKPQAPRPRTPRTWSVTGNTEYFHCGGNEVLGEAAGARLTRDAELGAGPHEAVLVLCDALEHAGVGHTQVRYRQGSVLHLDPVLDGDRKAPRGKACPASGGKRSRWPVFPPCTRHEAVGLGMQTSHLRMRRPRWKR